MDRTEIKSLAEDILRACKAKNLMLCTAESCTGGLISASLIDVPGSSAVVERGYVTYSNTAKTALLGVPAALIDAHGAVSEPVARAMAEGALRDASGTAPAVALALAVTGIAGPGGGTADKPEGRVHFAAAMPGACLHVMRDFGPLGRENVRLESVAQALKLGLEALRG